MKTILITGATDGIGFVTAQTLAKNGHHLLIHGRNRNKLADVKAKLTGLHPDTSISTYQGDLSLLSEVKNLVTAIKADHHHIDGLINNAGVYKIATTVSSEGFDIRYMVNTIAPYLLTQSLLPLMDNHSRVVNLSSAAQQSLNADELLSPSSLADSQVYAKSKLAITMWSHQLGNQLKGQGPMIVAVNPASMLGSKMVKDAYGVKGGDLQIGADILVRAVLSEEFAHANDLYFDNDSGRFASPHPDALNEVKNTAIIAVLDKVINQPLNRY